MALQKKPMMEQYLTQLNLKMTEWHYNKETEPLIHIWEKTNQFVGERKMRGFERYDVNERMEVIIIPGLPSSFSEITAEAIDCFKTNPLKIACPILAFEKNSDKSTTVHILQKENAGYYGSHRIHVKKEPKGLTNLL